MAESGLSIAEREAGSVTILALTGQILLDDGDLAIGREIRGLVARGRVQILLDMSRVTYIDSAGVGSLAGSVKTVREHHGDMKLLNLPTRGQRISGMMKLHLVFETFENEDQAVESFAFNSR